MVTMLMKHYPMRVNLCRKTPVISGVFWNIGAKRRDWHLILRFEAASATTVSNWAVQAITAFVIIQSPIAIMTRFSVNEMKPSGTFELPPTQAHFNSRLST